MADEMVLATQKWLNKTYRHKPGFGSVAETGKTGRATINGLIRALQIELGITATANNFGSGTQSRFKRQWPGGIKKTDEDDNVHGIIQGALWCKGYPAEYGGITRKFTDNVANSVRTLKADIGLSDTSATVNLELMMALLSMKQFKLLSAYGGKDAIRGAQQAINRQYKKYTGIVPTDGLYGREMNKALIQVLQSLQGFTPAQATGNFGSGTRSRLRTISSGTSQWIWLATVALVCNGYPITPTSTWTSTVSATIRGFQEDYMLPVTGVIDPTTWMSLLTSKGDPDRACVACDTRFEITDELAKHLKADGYQIVGRYLSEPGQDDLVPEQYFKAIRPGELECILAHGLKFFPIFQEYSTALRHFSPADGARHAAEAYRYARIHRIPPTVIYFAVDVDVLDYQIDSHILPYFKAVSEGLAGGYRVGIYASRNVCQRVIDAGFAVSAFVSDMSTGFSGNLGFPIPDNWNYDQFHEISGYKGRWDLDKVAYSGRIAACDHLTKPVVLPKPGIDPGDSDQDPLYKWVAETEKQCVEALTGFMSPFSQYRVMIGQFILEWLRKPKYWSNKDLGLWRIYTPEFSYPPEMQSARLLCASVCARQPEIRGTIPNRDIEHLAATMLGYINWGSTIAPNTYGLGDLGGWGLDLLQIWGSYDKSDSSDSLATWLLDHLGQKGDDQGFGYDDVLADADAWLLVKQMKSHPGDSELSISMKEIYGISETSRIKKFYKDRFGANPENVAQAFTSLADGIDIWVFENIDFTKEKLLLASGADRLPDEGQSHVLGRTYAAILSQPDRV